MNQFLKYWFVKAISQKNNAVLLLHEKPEVNPPDKLRKRRQIPPKYSSFMVTMIWLCLRCPVLSLILDLKPIILQQEASSGRTIIEKIEDYTNVGFGIVLYTPCDIGYEVGSLERQHRSRQNVIFEHGYLIGKLGRQKVIPVFKDQIEKPSDIEGLVYMTMDKKGNWKEGLKREIRDLGHRV